MRNIHQTRKVLGRKICREISVIKKLDLKKTQLKCVKEKGDKLLT